jgi:hypothetical protein
MSTGNIETASWASFDSGGGRAPITAGTVHRQIGAAAAEERHLDQGLQTGLGCISGRARLDADYYESIPETTRAAEIVAYPTIPTED